MTYDVHTHVGCDPGFYLRGWWPYAATAQDLLGHLDRAGLTQAVCFPFTLPSAFDSEAFGDGSIRLRSGRVPFDRENALLREEIDRIDREKRLLQFAMFDPAREVAAQVKLIEPLIGQIAGLKAQTTVIEAPIRALLDEGKALMELARRNNLPVLLHTAVFKDDRWAQVSDCLEVARAYPDVRFNLAHSLRFDEPGLAAAAELDNVWVDCSAHLAHCQLARENRGAVAAGERRVRADYNDPPAVLRACHQILKDKYLWGSDNPFMSWCADRMAVVYSYADEVACLRALPAEVQTSMTSSAPEAWLFGKRT